MNNTQENTEERKEHTKECMWEKIEEKKIRDDNMSNPIYMEMIAEGLV